MGFAPNKAWLPLTRDGGSASLPYCVACWAKPFFVAFCQSVSHAASRSLYSILFDVCQQFFSTTANFWRMVKASNHHPFGATDFESDWGANPGTIRKVCVLLPPRFSACEVHHKPIEAGPAEPPTYCSYSIVNDQSLTSA